MLLYTRKLILDREFVAERCNTLAGLTEILSRGHLDLVLICQSVPAAECEEVIEMVRAASPEVKVLVMQAGHPASCSVHSDAAMESLEGPPALLEEIRGILGVATPSKHASGMR
jgi:DNA-binding NtrC family response regulator